MPSLCRAVAAKTTRDSFSVAEVIGQVSGRPLADFITATCADKGKTANVQRVELAHLPGQKEAAKREDVLADNGKTFRSPKTKLVS